MYAPKGKRKSVRRRKKAINSGEAAIVTTLEHLQELKMREHEDRIAELKRAEKEQYKAWRKKKIEENAREFEDNVDAREEAVDNVRQLKAKRRKAQAQLKRAQNQAKTTVRVLRSG